MNIGTRTVVAKGTWLYDGDSPQPVFIVRLNYDFWYELGKEEGDLEEGEEPRLDKDGFAYYVSFHSIGVDGSFWPNSLGNITIDDAKATAQLKMPSAVQWEDRL